MGNPVVHFEIGATDKKALESFYAELLGWNIQPMQGMEDQYSAVETQAGEGINGGISPSEGPYVTFYVAVDDLDATLAHIESLGGSRVSDPVVIPGVVSFALFKDPQGNMVGIVRADTETPDESGVTGGDNPGVGWFEILGTDGKALRSFYGEAFGWTFKVSDAEGMDYGEVDTGSSAGIPGGIGTSQGEPVTTVYAGVDDVTKYLERAEALGATKVMGPMDVGGGTEIAAIRDPQGNLFGYFKHSHPH